MFIGKRLGKGVEKRGGPYFNFGNVLKKECQGRPRASGGQRCRRASGGRTGETKR
jgi:hypothetical protein